MMLNENKCTFMLIYINKELKLIIHLNWTEPYLNIFYHHCLKHMRSVKNMSTSLNVKKVFLFSIYYRALKFSLSLFIIWTMSFTLIQGKKCHKVLIIWKKSDFKETVNGVPYYFYINSKLHLPGFPLEKLTFIKSQTT